MITLFEKYRQFSESLSEMVTSDPFLVPGSENQAKSLEWIRVRRLIFTASEAKKNLGLSSARAKMTFLQNHPWGIKEFAGNEATRYGTENEGTALRAYEQQFQSVEGSFSYVESTGLWINEKYPMLGCSPDGIVAIAGKSSKLVEIKCPYVMRNGDPNFFDKVLTSEQFDSFPLRRCKDGKTVELKKTHAHSYHIQMVMDDENSPLRSRCVESPQFESDSGFIRRLILGTQTSQA